MEEAKKLLKVVKWDGKNLPTFKRIKGDDYNEEGNDTNLPFKVYISVITHSPSLDSISPSPLLFLALVLSILSFSLLLCPLLTNIQTLKVEDNASVKDLLSKNDIEVCFATIVILFKFIVITGSFLGVLWNDKSREHFTFKQLIILEKESGKYFYASYQNSIISLWLIIHFYFWQESEKQKIVENWKQTNKIKETIINLSLWRLDSKHFTDTYSPTRHYSPLYLNNFLI